MEEKVAIIGIFITDNAAASKVNDLLHEFSDCIIGRMGIPYREKSMNIISIIVSADPGRISALSGRLGRIEGITSKAMQAQGQARPFPQITPEIIFRHVQCRRTGHNFQSMEENL